MTLHRVRGTVRLVRRPTADDAVDVVWLLSCAVAAVPWIVLVLR